MTKGPVLVDIIGALETDRLLLEHHWVQHHQHLGRLRRAHAKSLVSREVDHAGVELVRVVDHLDPITVKSNKLLNAVVKLVHVEQGHVEVSGRVVKGLEMLLGTESLHLASLVVFQDADSLVNGDTIVKSGGRCLHPDGSIGDDLWLSPAFLFGPVDAEHVVGENSAEHQLVSTCGLDLANVNLVDLNVCGLE